jgi:hypothetical protein
MMRYLRVEVLVLLVLWFYSDPDEERSCLTWATPAFDIACARIENEQRQQKLLR